MERDDNHNVLRDVVNEDNPSPEDEDFALAKMMQEQERAFFHARSQRDLGENEANLLDLALLRDDLELPNQPGPDADGFEASSTSDDSAAGASDEPPVDDEELARRLHAEEQLGHQRRILELAGIAPGSEIYSDEDDDDFLTDDSVDPDEMTYEELRALGDAVGVVSRGASTDIISALPFARYAGSGRLKAAAGEAAAVATAECQEEQCVVCRMEFESGEDVKVLPCKHVFHPGCIDQWLTINKACPICASEVTMTSEGPAAGEKIDTKPSKR